MNKPTSSQVRTLLVARGAEEAKEWQESVGLLPAGTRIVHRLADALLLDEQHSISTLLLALPRPRAPIAASLRALRGHFERNCFVALVPPGDGASCQELSEAGLQVIETRGPGRSGSLIPQIERAERLHYLEREVGTLRQTCRELELRNHNAFTKAPVGLAFVNHAGQVLAANVECGRLLGRPAQMLVGSPLGIEIRRDGVYQLSIEHDAGLVVVEARMQRSEWAGNDAYFVVLSDVTQQATYHNMRDVELERYELSSRGARDGLWEYDLLSRSVYYSPRWRAMLGYVDESPRNDIDGWRELIHPEDLSDFDLALQSYISGSAELFSHEYRMRSAGGEYRWMHVRGTAEHNEHGLAVRMAGTQADITDRRRREQERLRFEQQMAQSQKLESLGVLAAGVSHDFNNLLMVISANLSLVADAGDDPELVEECVAQIKEAVDKGAGLSQQMLDYAGHSIGLPETCDLSEIVRNNSRLIELVAGRGATVELLPSTEPLLAMADARQMGQVLMNLVGNAAEAAVVQPARIVVRTGWRRFDRAAPTAGLQGAHLTPGEYVVLEVSDNGPGFTPEVQERLFEPFFSTKFDGRGLGLASVLGIVRNHGGAIEAESRPQPGVGAMMRVYLPRHRGEEAVASPQRRVVQRKSVALRSQSAS